MNFQVIINWKTVAAVGASAVGIILALKVEPDSAKDALTSVANSMSGTLALLGNTEH